LRTFAATAETGVVIPVHNRRVHTASCLQQLRRLDAPELMVIVVDDGSTDGTAAYLMESHADVHVLQGSGSLWWSGAVDLGCRFAIDRGASRLVLINNDILEMSPNLICDLSRVLDTYGGLACAVIVEDRPSGRREIVAAGGSVDWRNRGLVLREGPRDEVEYRARAEDVECDWLSGAALAFGREVFLRLKGFDARRFPQYRGDADFTLRAGKEGYKRIVTYAAWVVNDTSNTWINFRRRLTYREFLLGFISLRSPYNLRETILFAWRHCPKRYLPRYLVLLYLRFAYAFWKTRHRLHHGPQNSQPDAPT
jgi:GT2 family glycosyltransferase